MFNLLKFGFWSTALLIGSVVGDPKAWIFGGAAALAVTVVGKASEIFGNAERRTKQLIVGTAAVVGLVSCNGYSSGKKDFYQKAEPMFRDLAEQAEHSFGNALPGHKECLVQAGTQAYTRAMYDVIDRGKPSPNRSSAVSEEYNRIVVENVNECNASPMTSQYLKFSQSSQKLSNAFKNTGISYGDGSSKDKFRPYFLPAALLNQ